ncbi:MAG: cytochrome c1 [Alphaproteobacteria bacterium]|nr:cytochrome c1 [Alphaproteobacteria bacterium]MBV9693693.1 cytochrome c1 [Alphaproteobacteria bacterium]
MRIVLPLALAAALLAPTLAAAQTADSEPLPPRSLDLSFQEPYFGLYDRAALQRGYQVYKEVCSACHSLNRIAFHDLGAPGGPGFSEAQVKALAAAAKVPAEPNDKGETYNSSGERITRPGIPADAMPAPFANVEAARAANNGAAPPDLSVIVKAREGGANYVYSILTGFGQKPPPGFKVLAGKYYNPYFAGRNISMPPPLTDGAVTYSDGTKAAIDQEAKDVVTFLSWAAEPKMEERKQLGFEVVAFLVLLSALLYLSYRRVWRDKH